MKTKTLLWLLVILVCLNGVLGLGIRPAKTTLDFMPGVEREYQFKIANNEHKDLNVELTVEGELADYIELSTKTVHLGLEEELRPYTFKVKLPKDLPPGTLKSQIIVTERLPEVNLSGNVFAARLKVGHDIFVNVPYPEKYLEAEINYSEKGESLELSLSAKNLGQEDIKVLKTTFDVYENNKKIVSTETKEESLKSQENKVLSASVDKSKVAYGEFNILASIFYDGYWLELEKKIIQGEPEIEILYFDKYFLLGKINKFTLNLLNKWNKKLEKVFAEIFVFKEGKQIDEIRTASFDMEGGEMKKVEGYFDASNKEIGDYEFEVVVTYGEKKTHQKIKGSILNEEEYKKVKEERGNLVYILIGVLFGLIVILLGVLVGKRRKEGG